MKKPIKFNLHFVENDIPALLAALPLVISIPTDTPVQQEVNALLCATAGQKLASHRQVTPNEFRIIAVAVIAARDVLSGKLELNIDTQVKAALSPYFFTYFRLASELEKILDTFFDS